MTSALVEGMTRADDIDPPPERGWPDAPQTVSARKMPHWAVRFRIHARQRGRILVVEDDDLLGQATQHALSDAEYDRRGVTSIFATGHADTR